MNEGQILYVRGIGRTISKEELTIYFQSREQSGGGDISSIDLKEDEAVVTFEGVDAAQNVGSRTHIIDGTQVEVSVDPFMKDTKPPETSADQTCVVFIRGLSKNTPEDDLLNYLENTRRSGGGPVEGMNIEGDSARVKFESAEVANRVVARDSHILNGTALNVSLELRDAGDKKDRTIQMAGLPANTNEEWIWLYFENKRRSGGGEVENVDFRRDAGVAFVTFKDADVATRVIERNKHTLNGSKLDVSLHLRDTTDEKSKTIKVAGLPPSANEEWIWLYFENKRRSGGGEVENVDFRHDAGEAFVTFKYADVANCVVERDKHTLNGTALNVSLELRDTREKKPDKTIEVAGLAGSTNKENKRSGGVEVETVDFQSDAGVDYLTFEDADAMNTVLRPEKHSRDGPILNVTPGNVACCLPDKEEIQESRTIEVTGLARTTTKDGITIFFENTLRSGGGDVEHVNFTPELGYAAVTFVTAESARRVINKGSLILDKAELSVTLSQPLKKEAVDTKRLIVKGLSEKTTSDGIECYTELISGVDVLTVVFGEQGCALLTFNETLNYQAITQAVANRPLDDKRLSIEQVPVCNCVEVTGLNRENTTKDAVFYYFDNPKNGGDVSNVELNIKEGWALVYFEDPQAIAKVMEKHHALNGAQLEIRPHDSFFERTVSQPNEHEVQLTKSIPVDEQVMLFIFESYKADFTEIRDMHDVKINWEEGASSITVTPVDKASADKNSFDTACEDIASFIDVFVTTTTFVLPEAWPAVVDYVNKNSTSVKEEVKFQYLAQQHTIALTGKKKDVERLVEELQELKTKIEKRINLEASKTTYVIDIPQARLQILRDLNFAKELETEHEETEVSILLDKGKIQIRAPPDTVYKVSAAIWEAVANIRELSFEMSQNAVEILKSTECQAFIKDQFTANNLQATLDFDAENMENVVVMGLKTEVAEKASELVKRLFVEECLDLDEGQVQLDRSEKWHQLRYELTEKRILSLSFDKSNRKIWLVGTKEDVSFALGAVKRFLKENTIVNNVVGLPKGCSRFLSKYREQELRQIEDGLKEQFTRIKRVEGEDDEDLVVSGTTDGVDKAMNFIHDLASKVVHRKFLLNKPGMRKVLDRSKGKNLLSLLENENKCVIEHFVTEKDAASKKLEEVVEEANKKKKENLCNFLTPEGKNILVYKDNICDRDVDVIVNAANSKLDHVGGVSKAIAEAAGEVVKDECERYIIDRGPVLEGQVVVTSAGKLPFKKVIHVVVPRWRKEATREKAMGKSPREEKLLRYAVTNALDAAKSFKSIAIPAIGTGIYEFPRELCAQIMVDSALAFSQENPGCRLSEVQFTSIEEDVVTAFVKEMDARFLHDRNYQTTSYSEENAKRRNSSSRNKNNPTSSIPSLSDYPHILKYSSLCKEETNKRKEESLCSFLTPEGKNILVFKGNICERNVDVIVNSANSQLHHVAGVSKAIAEAAGEVIKDECERYIIDRGPVLEGQVVVTSAGKLPFKKVIHVVVPRWRKEATREKTMGKSPREEKLLRYAVTNALDAAKSFKSIAIPAIGTGIYEFPRELCAQIMVDSALAFFQENPVCRLSEIQFTSIDDDVVTAFVKEMDARFLHDRNCQTRSKGKVYRKVRVEKVEGKSSSVSTHRLPSAADILHFPNIMPLKGVKADLGTGDWSPEQIKHGVPESSCATASASEKGRSYLEIFADTKKDIDKVVKEIEKDVADQCKHQVIEHDAIAILSKQQKRKIKDLEVKHDVVVNIDEACGRISIRGDTEDVLDVVVTIHKILSQKIEEEHTRGDEELVKWFY